MKYGNEGRWDLFQKAVKSCLIPWNGSEALKFSTGQPQKKAPLRKHFFPAFPLLSGSGSGAFHKL
jgi:hypothetical protein